MTINSAGNPAGLSVPMGVLDIPALLVETRNALREGRTDAAVESAAMYLTAAGGLQPLERVFGEAQRLDLLVRLLWDRRETALCHLSAVAAFLRMIAAVENSDEYIRELRSWLLDESTASVSFSHLDFLGWFRGVDERALLDLFLFKYRGWNLSSAEKFAEGVRELAARCEIPQHLLEFLYQRRANRELDFSRWMRDIRPAQILNHFFVDANVISVFIRKAEGQDSLYLRRFRQAAALSNHVDMARAKVFFDGLDTSRGLLVCTFHGAFTAVLSRLFRKFMPDHYVVGQGPRDETGGSTVRNGRHGAAFRAVKALMQKNAVMIAPDGPFFGDTTSAEIRIFDVPFRISASAAVLAYEAGSDTCWCSVIREGERLVPVYVPGPRRDPGEKFEQFRDRWLSFYSAEIQAGLSSDPKNLVLRSAKWSSFGVRQGR